MEHTPPDEQLIAKAQAGDLEARNALVMRHRGFLHSIIIQQCRRLRRNYESEELLAPAIESLCRAIMSFDPSRGAKLLTMAKLGIEQAVRRAILRDSPLTRPSNYPPKAKHAEAWKRAGAPMADIDAVPRGSKASGLEAFARLELEERRLLARWALEQLDER